MYGEYKAVVTASKVQVPRRPSNSLRAPRDDSEGSGKWVMNPRSLTLPALTKAKSRSLVACAPRDKQNGEPELRLPVSGKLWRFA